MWISLKTYTFLSTKKRPDIIESLVCEAMSYSHRGKPPTTIGAKELNFRVRYGNGCDLFAIITSLVHGCTGVYVATGRGVLSRRSLEHLIGFQYTALSFVNCTRSFSHVLEYAPSIAHLFPCLACVLKPSYLLKVRSFKTG